MFELRKYHGDKVMSLTYDDKMQSFSVGIIAPGEYSFGSLKKEIFTVTSGKIGFWTEDEEEWKTCDLGESFSVPEGKNFKLTVIETSSYICFYE
ncbi:MAG: hypothetical protein DRI89_01550 [Bacteroidetes bacterium]|nr:MAG: hypothetical protein DRI89_01550 [Bacteroidota bacterium]